MNCFFLYWITMRLVNRLSTRPRLPCPNSCMKWRLPCYEPHEDLLTIVKRRKLQWYGHVSRSSGLAKTILQGTLKGGRRQSGQRKRWEDNIREWTGLEFAKSQRAVENREKMEKTDCKIIRGTPTTLAVKGLMMMMIVLHGKNVNSPCCFVLRGFHCGKHL